MRAVLLTVLLACCVAAAQADDAMKATAAQKMTSPAQKKLMAVCQRKAQAQNVPMTARAKFVMDCMTAVPK